MKELSRLERHRSRNKGWKRSTSDSSPHGLSTDHSPNSEAAYAKEVAVSSGMTPVSGGLSRRSRYGGRAAEQRVSTSSVGSIGLEGEEAEELPMRSKTYSSYRVRMSKWFVNSLIILFVMLMAALLWWGMKGAPPLKELL